MQAPSLDDLVHAYRKGRATRELVMERVAALVYREPWRYGFDDEDAAADALVAHRGRIEALADRFEDRGIDFEVYLGSCLRFLARTMRRERRRAFEKDLVCERAVASASGSAELEAMRRPWGGEERAAASIVAAWTRTPAEAEAAAFASRLVFLVLKCAWEVDDELAERAAAASGVDPAWLGSALAQARRSLEAERCRYERIQARRNGSWCRLRLLESRLGSEPEGARRERSLAAMERERLRLARAREEMAGFKPVVPNSVVARILGVPKGTVDSGLYYLKRRSRALGRSARQEPG
ncbi:MAG TPA: hypothetical protein PLB91_05590 [Spirochaetales bacterium]|nr:hypothetical protein [Spirochaetales bacterium]HRY55549.1 hypothetical protein [Spirochaetia bacterium]